MTLVKKTIGRNPLNFGSWSASFINPKTRLEGYGKKFRTNLYGCEFESLMENNTFAPATLVNGVVTPDTVHWRLVTGMPANYGLDGKLSAETARAMQVEGGHETRISDLEESVGTGGSVDERIAAEGAKHYLKTEIYTKEEVNGMITTPDQDFVTVEATEQTTAATDVLPATGEANTIYRVANWDGSQYSASVYSEYTWNTTTGSYVKLDTKSIGIDEQPTAGSDNLVKSGGVGKTNLELSDKKLNKVLSNNIINSTELKEGYFIRNNGTLGQTSNYLVSELISVSDITSITLFGVVDAPNVLTYAVYDLYGNFIRGAYQSSGIPVTYTKEESDVYIRLSFRTVNINENYPTYFACLGTALKPFVPYTDYLPLDELSDKVDKLKLNKIMSNNIINPISIIPRRFINISGQLQETEEGSQYSVSELIDVSDIENISMLGIVNSASVLTYAVYDEYKAFRRGTYADLGTTVVYSKQAGDKYIRIGLRTLNLTEDYPTYFACLGSTLKEYDKYSDYVPLRDLEEVVARITDTSSEELTPIQCPPLYSIANDVGAKEYWTLNSSFDYVMNLYADHFFDFSAGEERGVRWKDNDLDKLPLVNPIGLSEVGGRHLVFNNGTTIWNRTITKKIYAGMSEASVNIPQISILNSATANFFPKVLFIGDSVTDGSGAYAPLEVTEPVSYSTYWSYIWKLFKDDKVRNNNVGFDFVSLGVQSMRNLMYDNVRYRVSAEGNGGWTLRKYLYEYKFNTPDHKNRFYDADKVGHWQDSELNAAGVGFSISKYLSRYKTLADDGITPLVVGETAGTEVTESDKYFNLCTPNIISIQLGFNDLESNYIGDLKLMIKAIREEYPNMPIIVSLIDGTGTYNKELYPEMNPADISLTHNTHHKMHSLMVQIQNETFPSGVYILGSYFIQSTAYSVALKPYMQPQNIKYENFKPYYVENGSSPDLHPGTYAHCDWAYQFSALIKYIMYQSNQ